MEKEQTKENIWPKGNDTAVKMLESISNLEFSCTVFVKALEQFFARGIKENKPEAVVVLVDGIYYHVVYDISTRGIDIKRSETFLHNYIVFDLEATCWQDRKVGPNETIEIGAVKLRRQEDGTISTVEAFQTFVKPKTHTNLSDFCKQLTTITQEEVDSAGSFPEEFDKFLNWCTDGGKNFYTMLSWGKYDDNQITKDCRLNKVEKPNWVHHSLKHQYLDITGKRCSVPEALKDLSMDFSGTYHRGIDDAKNISKIFIAMDDHWMIW